MNISRPNYTMTAVVCHGPQDYRVEQVPRPKPGPHELVLGRGAPDGDLARFREGAAETRLLGDGPAPLRTDRLGAAANRKRVMPAD